MGEISIIGLDLAKQVFQVHGARVDGSVVLRKKHADNFWHFFQSCHPASSPWKLVQPPITGHARSVSLVMRSGWSHPPM